MQDIRPSIRLFIKPILLLLLLQSAGYSQESDPFVGIWIIKKKVGLNQKDVYMLRDPLVITSLMKIEKDKKNKYVCIYKTGVNDYRGDGYLIFDESFYSPLKGKKGQDKKKGNIIKFKGKKIAWFDENEFGGGC